MAPLHLCIALGPLVTYTTIVGGVHLFRRPFVWSGPVDLIGLGIAVIGFVIVGPMELFYPEGAPAWYGARGLTLLNPWFGIVIWLLFIGLYLMSLLWIALSSRPRLVVYNLDRSQLLVILEQLLPRLDSDVQWLADAVMLPKLGIQFSIEHNRVMRCLQLVSVGTRQNLQGWHGFHRELRQEFLVIRTAWNPAGTALVVFAIGAMLLMVVSLMGQGQEMHQALMEMLRL